MRVYGLTGNIGSGKSTVARMLRELGAFTVDADEVAGEIVRPGEPALSEIAARFGREVLREDGTLDRAALADAAFSDPASLRDLNSITHPRILGRIREKLSGAGEESGVAFVEAALLEDRNGPLGSLLDGVVAVTCPRETRERRTAGRAGMTPGRFRLRADAQPSEEEKTAPADFVLENASDMETLRSRVLSLWEELRVPKP